MVLFMTMKKLNIRKGIKAVCIMLFLFLAVCKTDMTVQAANCMHKYEYFLNWGEIDYENFDMELEFVRYCSSCREMTTIAEVDKERVMTQAPNCKGGGTYTFYASYEYEGTVYTTENTMGIPRLPHNYGEGVVIDEGTCCTEGKIQYTCPDCGYVKTTDNGLNSENHSGERVVSGAVEASCSATGYTGDTVCSGCNAVFEYGVEIPKTEHTWNEGVITTDSTCVSSGVKTFTCNCGETKTEDVAVNTDNHCNTEIRNVKEESCAEEGYTGDTYCADCNTLLIQGIVINKTEHTWNEGIITTESTCSANGVKTYSCDCGEMRTEEVPVDPSNHCNTEIRNTVEASCSQEGYTGDTYCKDCNILLIQGNSISKLEHTWNEGIITSESTCISSGVRTYSCVCGETRTEEIPVNADNHCNTELRNAVTETCSETGYTGDTYCKDCNTLLIQGSSIDKLEHTWDKGVITTESTCVVTGVRTFTCNCGATKTEEIPVNTDNHCNTEIRNEAEASCSEAGYTGDTYCSDCNSMLIQGSSTDKKEHVWNEGVTTKVADCINKGEIIFTCEVCLDTRTEETEINGSNHTGATKIINQSESTCTNEGYSGDTICSDCKAVVSYGNAVEKIEHNWELESTETATCCSVGKKIYRCSECGEGKEEEITIDNTNHSGKTELVNVVNATCTEQGYTGDIVCKGCNSIISSGQLTDKVEHLWNNGEIVTEASCKDKGIKKYVCSLCSDTKFEEIPFDTSKHGDTEQRNVKSASCTQEGYSGDLYCKDCDSLISEGTVIEKKSHIKGEATKENVVDASCIAGGSFDVVIYCTECHAEMQRDKETTGALGHTWDNGAITNVPTCTEKGIREYTCVDCGATKTEEIETDSTNHANTDIQNMEEASCSKEGYSGDTVCLDCHKISVSGTTIPKAEHSWDNGNIIKSANCIEKGSMEYVCGACGETRNEDIPADSDNHTGNTEVLGKVEADCENEGYTGDTHCKDCGAVLLKGSIVTKKNHNPLSAVIEDEVPATCQKSGEYYEVVYCSECKCEISRTKKETDVLPHTWDNGTVTEATCSREGKIVYVCEVCGESTVEIIPVDEAKHGELEIRNIIKPTCTEEGYTGDSYCKDCDKKVLQGKTETKINHSSGNKKIENKIESDCITEGGYDEVVYCTVCDTELSRNHVVIEAIGHNWQKEFTVDKEPTCSATGSKSIHCRDCSAVKNVTEIEMVAHTFNEWKMITAPDCVSDGEQKHICENCGFIEKEKLAALGHTWESDYTIDKEATCTLDGSKSIHCKSCEKTKDTQIISAHGHSYGKWETVKAATCVTEGAEKHICKICDYSEIREILANGHNWNRDYTVDVEPSCTEDGAKSIHCADCDETKDREKISALGHSYGEWVTVKMSNCVDKGLKERKCAVCNSKDSETIEALGHDWSSEYIVDVEATCTENGSRSIHCNNCETKKDQEEIFTNGHDYGEWIVIIEPTCTTQGIQKRNCQNCNNVETSNMDELGHIWNNGTVIKEPTQELEGIKEYCCINCDEKKTESLDKLPVYTILDDIEGEWSVDECKDVVFRIDGNCDKFKELLIDRVVVDPIYYTIIEGSTIITIKADYVKTLSAGSHVVTAQYTDGSVDTELIVAKEEAPTVTPAPDDNNEDIQKNDVADSTVVTSPKTGDNTTVVIPIIFGILGLSVISFMVCHRKGAIAGNGKKNE